MFAQENADLSLFRSLKLFVAISLITFTASVSAQAQITDTTASITYDINATAAGETILVQNGPIANGFQTIRITFGGNTIDVANKSTLNINALGGLDTVTVDVSLRPAGINTLRIDTGSTSGDRINLSALNLSGGTVVLINQALGQGAGEITDINGSANNVTATNLVLRHSCICTGGSPDALETTISNLALVTTGSNFAFITNTGNLTLTNLDGLTSSSGGTNATLEAIGGSITIAHNLSVLADVNLNTPDAAGAGQDVIINAGVTVGSNNGSTTINAGDNFTLSTTAVLNGAPKSINLDYFDADPGGGTATINGSMSTGIAGSINGGNDSDTFTINKQAGGSLFLGGGEGSDIYTVNFPDISGTLQVIEQDATSDQLTINGTSGADTFNITKKSVQSGTGTVLFESPLPFPAVGSNVFVESVTVNGGEGGDQYNFTLTDQVGQLLTISDTGLTGTDALTTTGTAGADTFTINGTSTTLSNQTINYNSSLETINAAGLAQSDTFNVKASPTAPINIDGDDPAIAPGDTLNYDAEGRAASRVPPAGDGSIVSPPRAPVNFTQIETVNITNDVVANPLAARSWTTVADSGVLEDESNPARPTYTNFTAAANAGSPAGTYVLRYNIQATEGLTGAGADTRLRVRFRDEGAGSQVTVAIRASGLAGGMATLGTVFNSNAFAASPGFQTQEVVMPAITFDFTQNNYWLEVTLTKTSPSNQPGFASAQINQQ